MIPTVHLFNSLTQKIEEFVPNCPEAVKMYTCGPTVYHFAHIGNLRTYIMEDILEKTFRYIGYHVDRVMNITDVGHLSNDSDDGDDKMVTGAKRENKSVMEIAEYYTNAFFCDCQKLNIRKPDIVEPATHCIAEFIHMIEGLMEKGYAYPSGGNIYFDTSKLKEYYVFSSQTEKDLMVGVRENVFEDKNKRNKSDFVLWFTKSKFEDQELKWDSPWGVGYPGWHIECSGISLKHLGEFLDIHCGGVDNIFPHHTNEIAQTESYVGHTWCKYWFHINHLVDQSGKMSKSENNFVTVAMLEEKGYDPIVYRLFCLQSHYRKPLLFRYEILDNMANTYQRLVMRVSQLQPEGTVDDAVYERYKARFAEALCDDLNTSNALSVVYDVLKDPMNDATKYALIKSFDEVLSLNLTKARIGSIEDEFRDYIMKMIDKRKEAKRARDYVTADNIRNELLEKGVILEDTREGTKWKLKNDK